MEKAQAKVEARNFEIRKNLLKFDDVMNDQRKVIYDQRVEIMKSGDIRDKRAEIIDEVADHLVSTYIPKDSYQEKWEIQSLKTEVLRIFNMDLPIDKWADEDAITEEEIFERIANESDKFLDERDEKYGKESMLDLESRIYVFVMDQIWKDHLHFLDQLRQGINLRAYAQKDPLNEYKKEAFEAFRQMLVKLNEVFMTRLFHLHVQIDEDDAVSDALASQARNKNASESRFDPAAGTMSALNPAQNEEGRRPPQVTIRTHVNADDRDPNDPSTWGKVARNEPCPCGSGKKYKQCHGKLS